MNCLTSMYVVEVVGTKHFANAFGIVSLARGLASIIGPYLTGYLSYQFFKGCFE